MWLSICPLLYPFIYIDEAGKEHEFRRIRIALKKETRDGDKEIAIITNVPKTAATGIKIAELYQGR